MDGCPNWLEQMNMLWSNAHLMFFYIALFIIRSITFYVHKMIWLTLKLINPQRKCQNWVRLCPANIRCQRIIGHDINWDCLIILWWSLHTIFKKTSTAPGFLSLHWGVAFFKMTNWKDSCLQASEAPLPKWSLNSSNEACLTSCRQVKLSQYIMHVVSKIEQDHTQSYET